MLTGAFFVAGPTVLMSRESGCCWAASGSASSSAAAARIVRFFIMFSPVSMVRQPEGVDQRGGLVGLSGDGDGVLLAGDGDVAGGGAGEWSNGRGQRLALWQRRGAGERVNAVAAGAEDGVIAARLERVDRAGSGEARRRGRSDGRRARAGCTARRIRQGR